LRKVPKETENWQKKKDKETDVKSKSRRTKRSHKQAGGKGKKSDPRMEKGDPNS